MEKQTLFDMFGTKGSIHIEIRIYLWVKLKWLSEMQIRFLELLFWFVRYELIDCFQNLKIDKSEMYKNWNLFWIVFNWIWNLESNLRFISIEWSSFKSIDICMNNLNCPPKLSVLCKCFYCSLIWLILFDLST